MPYLCIVTRVLYMSKSFKPIITCPESRYCRLSVSLRCVVFCVQFLYTLFLYFFLKPILTETPKGVHPHISQFFPMNLFTLTFLSLALSVFLPIVFTPLSSDAPVLSGMEPGNLLFEEGDDPRLLTSTLAVSSGDSLIAATAWISENLRSCEDVLNADTLSGITVSYDEETGVLSLLGNASAANYETVLRTVRYYNSNATNPFQVPRTITFQVHSSTNNSNEVARVVEVLGYLAGPYHLPYTESFETEGNGVRYKANSFNDGTSNFFDRLQNGSGQLANDPANIDGNWFWAGEDVSDTQGIPSNNCQNGNPLPSGHGQMQLANLLAFGYSNLSITVALAIGQDNRFGPSDGLLVQYAFDADINAENYQTIGAFYGDDPDMDEGKMRQDSTLNGEADPGAPVLNFTLTDYAFSIPDAGSLLAVRVVMTQNAGNEELIFDHIRVNGSLECLADAGTVTGAAQTVCPGDTISVGVDGQQEDPAYVQTFLLADPAGNVVDVQTSGSFILPLGSFTVYSYNYHGGGNAPANPTTLASIDCISNCCDLVAASFNVTASDSQAPNAVCEGVIVALDADGIASVQAADVDGGSSDNCGPISFSLSQTSFDCSHVGTNLVLLTATDVAGNQDTCSANVIVNDHNPPQLECQNLSVVLDEFGTAEITYTDLVVSASDACGIDSFELSMSVFNCSHVGANTVVLSATDVNGNSAACISTVTVVDQTAPIVFCKDLTTYLDSLGNTLVTNAMLNSGVVEACETDSAWISQELFTCDDLGQNQVQVYVLDINGNLGLCTSTVTVLDTIQPYIACPVNQLVSADLNCEAELANYTDDATDLYDNCLTGLVVIQTPAPGTTLGYPETVVTLTASDEAGNTASCQFSVTLDDLTAPNAECQDISVSLNTQGNASILPSQVNAGSSDACGIDTMTLSISTFTCGHTGPNNVTLTVFDLAGNSSSCEAVVLVLDEVAPEAICQNVTVNLDITGNLLLDPALVNSGSSDACGITDLSVLPNNFSCDDIGENIVTLTVSDFYGNSASCSATVTVQDQSPPTALCKNITVQLNTAGIAEINGLDVDNGSNDACALYSLLVSPNNFSCNNVGENTVTLTATDIHGNSATCQATVTVEDNVAPNAVCQNIEVSLDSDGHAAINGIDLDGGSNDACGIVNWVVSPSEFECAQVGTNPVTLTVSDVHGNEATCTATVTVLDEVAPEALCKNITVSLNEGGLASITAANVNNGSNDACGMGSLSVSPSSFSCANVGPNTVLLTVADLNGNLDTCSATVTIIDDTPPEALCQNVTINLNASGTFSLLDAAVNAGSSDNCELGGFFLSQTQFDCSHVGDNFVVLAVTDIYNNSSMCNATVTVIDNTAPQAQCQDLTLPLAADGTALLSPDDLNNGSSDACGIDSMNLSAYLFDCNNIGANTVTLTVFDPSGNSSSCEASIEVVDESSPVALCQNVTLPLNAIGLAILSASLVDNGSNDACGIASLSVSPSNFTCFEVGANLVTLIVTDVNGNESACQSTVSIVDQTPPEALCQDVTVNLNPDGRYTLLPTQVDAGSNDACGVSQITLSQTEFDCEHLGSNTVVLTVVDAYGNESACTATVTVVDPIAPAAHCQNVTITLDAIGQYTLNPTAVNDGSTDNCEILTFDLNQKQFDCSQVGVNFVTLTVTDLGGNESSCDAEVAVVASAACIAPEITNAGGPSISDPCTCLSNGQFAEEVLVDAGTGQNWTVVSTTLLNPVTLLPFAPGTALSEIAQGPGSSLYSLNGIHLDGEGYTITVSSPFYPGTTLSISNTCYYPSPQIVGLSGPYCINTAPITLIGDVGGVALESESFTVNGNPATVFAPGQLGIGTHTVVYTVNAGTAGSNDPSDPGCVASTSQTLQVVVTPSALTCNNFLNISVDENCEAFITPDMILEGSNYQCYDDYAVTVKLGINAIPNPITGTYLGQQLTVTITHLPSGNSCWSTVVLSDNLPPYFDCPTTPVVIPCTASANDVPPPSAFDNCTPVNIVLVDEFVDDNDPCDDGKVRIHKIWKAVDTYNNESGTCLQIIEVERPDDVDFPNDIIWECNQENTYPSILSATPLHPTILAAQSGIAPYDATGISSASVLNNTGSGIPLAIDGPYCNYAYSHSDLVVPGCGNSFDIVRTWTVIDWCSGLLVTSNNAGEDNIQLIRVVDVTPPQIVRPPFDLSASIPGDPVNNPCTSQGFLLPAAISDNCNTSTVRIFTPVGEAEYVNGQNGSDGGFVPAPGLPLGVHFILYQAEDACGNFSELNVPVEVVDDISPTAICKQVTTVSLSSNGMGTVLAASFDNGSFDNCCLDYIHVRRFDGDCDGNFDNFGPSVTFCCSDIGNNPIMVVVRVVDCYGNYNECMVQANVEDKLPPVTVQCPANQTITCNEYLDDLAAALSFGNYSVLEPFGEPTFYDNCSFDVDYNVSVTINTCQVGTITRSWVASDPFGNSPATCTQVIAVEHVSDWVVQFPADVILECDNGGLPPFGEPQIYFDECEMIGISFSDQTFYTVPDACYMIVRTWTAVNWCLYSEYGYNAFLELSESQVGQDFNGDGLINNRTFKDGVNNAGVADGYIVYQQVIKVVDDNAPVFQVDDLEVCILGTGCNTEVNLPVPSVADCNPSSSISITSDLPNPVSGNHYQYLQVPPGNYTATYAVSDLCGNTAYQTINIVVSDCKKPTPYCENGLIVEIMQTGMIDVSVTSFDAGSFDNCTSELLFSYSANINDTLRTYDCDLLGQQPIQMWVTDAAGNQDFCQTFIIVQDNMDVCAAMPIIAGRIHTEMDLNVANVMVDVNGGMFSQMTGSDGMYSFDLPAFGDYSVTPSNDANHVNGVTTLDLLFMKQHILGMAQLNSPYKMIAADINNSKHITTLDMLYAQQLILGMIDQFPNNTSWRFVPANYVFPDPTNPWLELFPELLSFNNLNVDELSADFVAVKIGDVNNSVQPNADAPAETRNLPEGLTLEADDRMLQAGEIVSIPFTASSDNALGYQLTLGFDLDALEFVSIEEGLAASENFGLRFLDQGHITANWHSDSPRRLHADEPLFTLHFRAKKALELHQVLRIAENGRTTAEAYLHDLKPRSLSLRFRSSETALQQGFELYQNVPNPFAHSTVVGFRIPGAGAVVLRVSDASGRQIKLLEGYFEAGYHELELRDLPASGLLFYQLETQGFTATRRMVATR